MRTLLANLGQFYRYPAVWLVYLACGVLPLLISVAFAAFVEEASGPTDYLLVVLACYALYAGLMVALHEGAIMSPPGTGWWWMFSMRCMPAVSAARSPTLSLTTGLSPAQAPPTETLST